MLPKKHSAAASEIWGAASPRCTVSWQRRRGGLAPAVAVLEADDVVFAEIAARLHLDQVQRDLAGILQPVRGAERDVGRLVLGQHHLLVAAADFGGALHDDPMLGAVMVHLQRQLAARFDHDVLDLHPMAVVQRR